MRFLKNHPFAVEAYFKTSTVLTFAVPKAQLQKFIPPCLSLDTFQEQWAFLAVAMVQTENLRPKGLPKFLGRDFFLIGYRIFVRFTTNQGKRLRGLYIIKSETNSKLMEFAGNIFTHYNYSTTDISQSRESSFRTIQSSQSDFELKINYSDQDISIPENSPFSEWKDARRFAGPLPFTFTYNDIDQSVLIIEGVRQNWKPKPIEVGHYSFGFLDELNLQELQLASAFEIENIPYQWKKGKLEIWTG